MYRSLLQVRGAAVGRRREPGRWRSLVRDTADVRRTDRVV